MISQNSQTSNKKASSSHRLDILRTFYYQAVLNYLMRVNYGEEPKEKKSMSQKEGPTENTVCKETYWCSEYHKCHAAKVNDNILCVLYNSSVPTHAMRFITLRTIKLLTIDKQICW